MVDEDPAETALVHDVRPRPHRRIEAVEDVEHAPCCPAVIREEDTDLVGLHAWCLRLRSDPVRAVASTPARPARMRYCPRVNSLSHGACVADRRHAVVSTSVTLVSGEGEPRRHAAPHPTI